MELLFVLSEDWEACITDHSTDLLCDSHYCTLLHSME